MNGALPRLALLVPTLGGGGAERVMVRLANTVAARGYDVDLIVFTSQGPFRSAVADEVELVDLGTVRARSTVPALVRYLRTRRPTSLLSTHDRANVLAVIARRMARVPTRVVVREASTFSQGLPQKFGRIAPLVPSVVRWAYRRADAVVAVSHGVGRDLIDNVGIPPDEVHVIGNPVVTPGIDVRSGEPLDDPWLAEGAPPVILGVGRLVPAKDFATLLKAFARIRQRTTARLILLGEGPERPGLEKLAGELGIGDRVRLQGFVDNPYAYMSRASAFVLSSRYEGLPGALIEAMACGCPVVSTDCPSGPSEILAGGRYGPLVAVGDVDALAEAVLRVLVDPPDRDRLRAGARPYAVDTVTDRYLGLMAPEGAGPQPSAPLDAQAPAPQRQERGAL